MTERSPIQADIRTGRESVDDSAGVAAERFREALARWASTVTVFAVRDVDVHATTATSFMPVSADPPLVAVSLGASAQALPYLDEGVRVGISLLAEDQSKWAAIFADPFPVGKLPWSDDGEAPPLIDGSVVGLLCTVLALHPTEGGSRIVLCRVDDTAFGDSDQPLVYWQRGYRRLEQ